jgi:hypothetical protein
MFQIRSLRKLSLFSSECGIRSISCLIAHVPNHKHSPFQCSQCSQTSSTSHKNTLDMHKMCVCVCVCVCVCFVFVCEPNLVWHIVRVSIIFTFFFFFFFFFFFYKDSLIPLFLPLLPLFVLVCFLSDCAMVVGMMSLYN